MPKEGSGESEHIAPSSPMTPLSGSFPFPLSFLAVLPLPFKIDNIGSSAPGNELARDNDNDGSSESGCAAKESESGTSGTLGWREGTSGMMGSMVGAALLFKLRALAR